MGTCAMINLLRIRKIYINKNPLNVINRKNLYSPVVRWNSTTVERLSPREILGIGPEVTDPKEIRLAYLTAAKNYHPDSYSRIQLAPNEKLYREEKFLLIVRAYEQLLVEPDMYAALGLEKNVHEAAIVAAYQIKMKSLQHDFSNLNRQAQMEEIRTAFHILSDPEARQKYDSGLLGIEKDLRSISKKYNVSTSVSIPIETTWQKFVQSARRHGLWITLVIIATFIPAINDFGV